jgi:hypothetical protein
MSMLSEQRRLCRELAIEARRDQTDVDEARLALVRCLRRDVASPVGLLVCFAAGLAAGTLLSGRAGRREKRRAGERGDALARGRRAVSTGLWILRLIEALAG